MVVFIFFLSVSSEDPDHMSYALVRLCLCEESSEHSLFAYASNRLHKFRIELIMLINKYARL